MAQGDAWAIQRVLVAAGAILLSSMGLVRADEPSVDGAPTMAAIHAACTRLADEARVLACVQERLPGAVDLPPHVRGAMQPADPIVDAGVDAWWARARGAINAHAERLAATGRASDLLAAGLLWQPTPVNEEDVALWPNPRSTAWFAAALAVRPRTPLLDWFEAHGCGGEPVACDRAAARGRLRQRDPRNLELHLLRLASHYSAGEVEEARAALADAAASKDQRMFQPQLVGLLLDAYRGVDWPPVPAALEGEFARRTGWGGTFGGDHAALLLTIARVTAHASPDRLALTRMCLPDTMDADLRADCIGVLRRLADNLVTVIDPAIALPRLARFAEGTPEAATWHERLRDFQWQFASASRLMVSTPASIMDEAAYGDAFATSGELGAMRMLLVRNGIALEAPDGWQAEGWVPGAPIGRARD